MTQARESAAELRARGLAVESQEFWPAAPAQGGFIVPGLGRLLEPLAGCRLLREAGRGATGVVLEAQDLAAQDRVALKLFFPGDGGVEAERRRLRELAALRALDHPGLVRARDAGVDQGLAYIKMDWVQGRSLGELLREGPLEPARAAQLMARVAEALDTAHQAGILHRDIKPANIVVDGDGRPHLVDFGLARPAGAGGNPGTGRPLGTPAFMSPEQAAGQPLSAASDIWSLGATLYHALAGRPPLDAPDPLVILERLRHERPAAPVLKPPLGAALEAALMRALERRPRDRYARALDFGRALDEALRAPTRPRRRHRLALRPGIIPRVRAAAALLTISALATGGWAAWAVESDEATRRAALGHETRGETAPALARLEALIARSPTDDGLRVDRARVLRKGGRTGEALSALEGPLARGHRAARLERARALAYGVTGKLELPPFLVEAAREELDRLERDAPAPDPLRADILALRARLARYDRQGAAAQRLFAQAAAARLVEPRGPGPAELPTPAARLAEGRRWLARCESADPLYPQTHRHVQLLTRAVEVFDRLALDEPKNVQARFHLAWARFLDGHPEEAASELRAVPRLESSHPGAAALKSCLHALSDELPPDLSSCPSEQPPRKPRLWLLTAWLCQRQDRPVQALRLLSWAEQQGEASAAIPALRAKIAWEARPPDVAEALYQWARAARLDPRCGYELYRRIVALRGLAPGVAPRGDEAETALIGGIMLFCQGQHERARDLLDRALVAQPGWALPRVLRGAVQLRLGALEQAEVDLARARQAAPEEPVLRFWLASLRAAQSRPEQALEELGQAEALGFRLWASLGAAPEWASLRQEPLLRRLAGD